MATELRSPDRVDLSMSRRSLVLVWQNPETRRFIKVGQVDALPDGKVAFHYLPIAASEPDFEVLDEFSRLNTAYVTDGVPAFFANRILSEDRRGYADYLGWLGLTGWEADDVPFEVLARTGAGRATDTFHVVEAPTDAERRFASRFFVSGIRHTADADGVVATLHEGTQLALERELSNEHNPQAVLINAADGRRIGYVPDWLCGDVYNRLADDRWDVDVVAERVNHHAPVHLRVLCRLEAQRG